MAIDSKTVRLLILDDSQNEAERLVSLFRNAGRATRVQRLSCAADLQAALQHGWDLLISAPSSRELSPHDALQAIRRQAKDIAVIQLVKAGSTADLNAAITAALTQGAQDALPQGEDERLILVAGRELANLEERRARRAAEVALREAEKRCQLLLDSSVDAIAYVHDGMHIYANRAYLELFGYEDADELEGMPMIDLIAAGDQGAFKEFLKNYQSPEGSAELNCAGTRNDGDSFKARMHFSPAAYDGEPCIQVVIRRDNGNAELEERLREISSQDLVTGLFNRNHFLELMDGAAQRAIGAGQPASLAYIRLDQYASLLAEIGIAAIGLLLTDLAGLLRSHFPAGAQLARFGDDVFTLLQPGLAPEQARPALDALLKRVEAHLFDVHGRTVQVSLSIGVAGLSEKTPRAQDVIDRAHRCADAQGSGNRLTLYDPAEELAAEASRGNVVAMLQQALDGNAFQVLFQPIISLRGDACEHYEVLLRLYDPHGEQLPPADLQAAAQQAGLAARIDRWVLRRAIEQLAAHRLAGHDTRLFVPIGEASLQDRDLLPWLSATLQAARLPADALIVQLSETDACTYLKQAKALSQGLHELHCQVALGRFGCAVNPFNTLRHLEVDFVKLDESFARELQQPEAQESVKELLAALHAQARLTIIPGVESASALATLWQAGVHYIQGGYLQAPSRAMDYDFSSGEDG